MQMTLDEFERNFFEPSRVSKYLENRAKWIEEYKKASTESRWTTYFMLLGSLAAAGRMTQEEYYRAGPARMQTGEEPTPERLYTMTALVDLLKQ